MLVTTPPGPKEGLKIYRCTPLPSGAQPLVLLDWRSYTPQGDDVLDVVFFIVTEEAVLQAKGTQITLRHFRHRRTGEEVSHEAIRAFVMDKAKMALEEQVREESAAAQLSPGSFLPVVLDEVDLAGFQILALRETWKARWREVRAMAPYTSLQSLLEELNHSPLLEIILDDLKPR